MLVRDLIEILSRVDPDLSVEMTMNMEYGCAVDPDMVYVRDYGRGEGPILFIDDMCGA